MEKSKLMELSKTELIDKVLAKKVSGGECYGCSDWDCENDGECEGNDCIDACGDTLCAQLCGGIST